MKSLSRMVIPHRGWSPILLLTVWSSAILGGSILGFAAYQTWFLKSFEQPGVVELVPAEQDLGEVRTEYPTSVSLLLRNRSNLPVRIMGGGGQCNATCCLELRLDGEIEVPAMGDQPLRGELKVRAPGPFTGVSEIIVYDGEFRTFQFIVKGIGVQK